MPPTIVVPISPGSDGDSSKWPGPGHARTPLHDERYRTAIGNKWMNTRGEAAPGTTYVIDKFPSGYRLYHLQRPSSKHIDTYVYGHPSGYDFKSTNEFYVHFLSLMKGSSNCQCKGCQRLGTSRTIKPQTTKPKTSVKQTDLNRQHVGPLPPPPIYYSPQENAMEMVDEEGTPDIWRALAQELRQKKTVDKAIEEPDSIDFSMEKAPLREHVRSMQKQPSWIPRVGELVLFVRHLQDGQIIQYDHVNKMTNIWSNTDKTWIGHPTWEAGIVSECGSEGESKGFKDDKGKQHTISYTGFRVEPLPEIGSAQKPWSKRSTYIPVQQIRPFSFWQEMHKHVSKDDYHATVKHGFNASATFSVLQKYHFKGTYPDATIFCKGVYIGPDLILVGDTVRLTPIQADHDQIVTDVLYVTSIKLKLFNMDAEESAFGENDTNPPPWYTCLHISGIGYSTDPSKAFGIGKIPVDAKLPHCLHGYGDWHMMHDAQRRLELPFTRILGRVYEGEAMLSWFGSSFPTQQRPAASFSAINKREEPKMDLSVGLKGILEARTHAAAHDPRINRAEGKTWYWGEHRVDSLDLCEIKGCDVGAHARFGSSNSPRQAKHLDAMKRAKREREREKGSGYKRQHKVTNEKRMSRDEAAAATTTAQMVTLSFRDIDMDSTSEHEHEHEHGDDNDDDLIADQLIDELASDGIEAGSPFKRQRTVVEISD